MRRRGQQDNSSYLSDLAFLLIIFFVLLAGSTTIGTISSTISPLPEASPAQDSEQNLIIVRILENGSWTDADGKPTTPETVHHAIESAAGETAMLLAIEPSAKWEAVTPALELCEKHGIPATMEMLP